MKDYFAILGLDRDASEETIKSTYRRLAREVHPDRFGKADQAGLAEASSRMVALNEAYETLSDAHRRKEHLLCLRADRAVAEAVSAPAAAGVAEISMEDTWTPAVRARAHAGSGVFGCVVDQYGMSALHELLSKKAEFPWQQRAWEGFDWAVESTAWLSRYYIAYRGFKTLDAACARKFVNYAIYAMEQSTALLRKQQFVFLLAFQKVNQLDSAMVQLRRFAEDHHHKTMVALLDVHRPRVIVCGPPLRNARFERLMACFAAAR